MKTRIQRVTLPAGRRILAISDLHGHAEGLKHLLHEAQFGKEDCLVIVGDLVEKGPESLRTLRMVMQLCREYTVYPLIGNVDLWRLEKLLSDDPDEQRTLLHYSLKARKWWDISFLDELCREIGIEPDESMDTQSVFPRLREHFCAELAFLQGLPTVLETQRMIFVHGGIPHENLALLENQDAQSLLKWDHFWQDGLSFQKYVVVGHWPVTLYRSDLPCCDPIIDRERHIICLDGGCGVKDEGQLNLLVLPEWSSEAFTGLRWNPLPAVTALDAQQASLECGYIHWGDHEVILLERTEKTARIRHHNREMVVPASFVWERDGHTYCNDVSDNLLAVSPGDRLGIIHRCSMGCYCKKDGVSGWYLGRYE